MKKQKETIKEEIERKIFIEKEIDYDVNYIEHYESYFSPKPIKWYEWLLPIVPLAKIHTQFWQAIFFGKPIIKKNKIYPPKIKISVVSPSRPHRKIMNELAGPITESSRPKLVKYKTCYPKRKCILIKDFGNEEIMSKREKKERCGIDNNWITYRSWYEFDINKFFKRVEQKLKELGISKEELKEVVIKNTYFCNNG